MSAQRPAAGRESLFRYHRCGQLLRLTMRLSVLELRQILIGIWARLDAGDREEVMQEMLWLHNDPDGYLTQRASAVARALMGDETVNLGVVAPLAHAELPDGR